MKINNSISDIVFPEDVVFIRVATENDLENVRVENASPDTVIYNISDQSGETLALTCSLRAAFSLARENDKVLVWMH